MTILEIKNSSAVSKITFNEDEKLIGISFNYNQEKEYLYLCENIDEIKEKIVSTEKSGESIGKLINSYRKDGTFSIIEVEST